LYAAEHGDIVRKIPVIFNGMRNKIGPRRFGRYGTIIRLFPDKSLSNLPRIA
jgi:hypothetical protein